MDAKTGSGSCLGWAARDASGFLSPYKFNRRALGSDDISVKITHCGVCYADVVLTRNKMGNTKYPVVPGHEIVGVVTEIGSNVGRFKVGDYVGVGTYVNSCRDCEYCNEKLEIHCSKGLTFTFDALDSDGTITKGGYSSNIVVHERNHGVHSHDAPPGKSLGVIGLGGLGHMAVKFGKAFGLKVTVFSTSASKKDEALTLLGADEFVISSDEQQMKTLKNSIDFIIDTASGDHPFDPYMSLLKVHGVLVLVGCPSEVKVHPGSLLHGAKTISGSAAGGTKDTQEMLNFCAASKVYPEIEVIQIQYINEALERMIKRDVKYRFVIDIENSLK